MYLSPPCLAASWHQIYSILSNPDSFYDDLLEYKTNPKDVSTLVAIVVLIRECFSGKLSNLLPHFLSHHCLTPHKLKQKMHSRNALYHCIQ